jgi:uncharacterized protein YozE (UPF0346 family)
VNGVAFYAWLKPQRGRDDSIGDLARDALRDRYFPQHMDDYDALYLHLFETGACPAALRAFDRAWAEYQRAPGRRNAGRALTAA